MRYSDPIPRPLFTADHALFREQVRRFFEREVVPHHSAWEEAGIVPRDLWRSAGEAGLLCPTVPEDWGGAGADFLYSAIVIEEQSRALASGPGFFIHSEMATPYLVEFGSPAQKAAWLPRLVSGEAIIGVAMTEPDAGSDLRAMRTKARRTDEGFVLSGQKVFISNGQLGDVFVVAAKVEGEEGSEGISLFLVDATLPGFRRGSNLKKIGAHAQDTSELFFDDIALPATALLGGETGQGFKQLMRGLDRERLSIILSCVARAEGALSVTLDYVAQRNVFGEPLSGFQNTQFKLAEVRADILVGRAMADNLMALYLEGQLDSTVAAAGKLWATEMIGRVADACLQLHGGWGYMAEYPISRVYVDARAERIAGGSSEVMKSIIGRALIREHGICA